MAKKITRHALNRVAELFGSTKHQKSNNPVLNTGSYDPEIHGNRYEYCQALLKNIYNETKGENTLFTLTPMCKYQIDQGWPEPPFVNVNIHGSKDTQKENWLGYIPIDFSDINYEQIIKDNGNVDVYGHIERSDGEYSICLSCSDEYRVVEVYAQHDKVECQKLTNLAKKSNLYYLTCTMKKSTDSKCYEVFYSKYKVANVSVKKIDEELKGADYGDIKLRISHFRDYDDAKPYSKLIISKKIILNKPA